MACSITDDVECAYAKISKQTSLRPIHNTLQEFDYWYVPCDALTNATSKLEEIDVSSKYRRQHHAIPTIKA